MCQDHAHRFDREAATWDDNPHRVALMNDVAEILFREVQITPAMDVLDYGCGTGLLSRSLAPRVRSVTAADDSEGMLRVLRENIAASRLANVRAVRWNLVRDPLPEDRYDLITVGMTLHHIADTETILRRFHQMLRDRGIVAIVDLDTEPGVFHDPDTGDVYHLGFDRLALKALLTGMGFGEARDQTVHVLRTPVAGGEIRKFPVFLITAQRLVKIS